ncbi:MAG: ABC transporter ATP-binding protein [Desulfobacterales bacterium]|nr:MAG: ABC transporter ATP-binding protein [Desulfobacterales bacterium]
MDNQRNRNSVILRVEGLKKYFPIHRGFFQRIAGWVKAVEDVSFEIERGRTLGLVGESGCGKTTVGRLILKLLTPDAGRIIYQGQDITDLSSREMKPIRKEIQIIFQDPYGSLNPRLTVGQTLGEGLQVAGIRSGAPRRERLEKLLQMVGMPPAVVDRYPHEFSGGQRQRIGIARALSVEPSLIICDEPISALDVSIQAQIINLLKDLQDQLGLSYLFISHDLNVVGYLCDHLCVMYKGHIMEYAPTDELFANPAHPYTLALLAAIPDPETPKDPPLTAENQRGTVAEPPAGCSYLAQCPFGEPACREAARTFTKVGPNHFIRCWKVTPSRGADYFSGPGPAA